MKCFFSLTYEVSDFEANVAMAFWVIESFGGGEELSFQGGN